MPLPPPLLETMEEFVTVNDQKFVVRNHALVISGIQIQSIGDLQVPSPVDGINFLIIRDTTLQYLRGVEKFTGLTNLVLSNNQIAKIAHLAPLGKLEVLDLSGNQIETIQGLENLRNLTTLNLSSNRIQVISGLDACRNLRHLELHDNRIKKIEGLGSLANLEFLSLKNNEITELNGLEHLFNLKKIELSSNPIKKNAKLRFLDGNRAQEIVQFLRREKGIISLEEMAAGDESCAACSVQGCDLSCSDESDATTSTASFSRLEDAWVDIRESMASRRAEIEHAIPGLNKILLKVMKRIIHRTGALFLLFGSGLQLEEHLLAQFKGDLPMLRTFLSRKDPSFEITPQDDSILVDVYFETSNGTREALEDLLGEFSDNPLSDETRRKILEEHLLGTEVKKNPINDKRIGQFLDRLETLLS